MQTHVRGDISASTDRDSGEEDIPERFHKYRGLPMKVSQDYVSVLSQSVFISFEKSHRTSSEISVISKQSNIAGDILKSKGSMNDVENLPSKWQE